MGLKRSNQGHSDAQAAEEAALWLQRLREQDTPQLRAEFSAWIRKGATNLEEFLFAQAMWRELDHIDPDMRQRLWSGEGPEPVVDFPTRTDMEIAERSRSGLRRPWLLSAAATLAIGVLGWMALSLELGSNVHRTDLGEQRSVKLADGSMMYLNTSSRAVVDFTDTERVIRLTSGEALFAVEHDSKRPFYVLTDSARVRAVGTEFNVYRNSSRQTHVAVIDGVVQVSPIHGAAAMSTRATGSAANVQLRAGDEASIDVQHVAKAREPDVERAVAWRARRLMFPGDPVGTIAAEFNRYNKVPIRIEGDELLARRMSGVFDADDPSPLLQFLERDPTIEVVRGEREIVIRSR